MSAPHALDRWLHDLPEPVKNRFFYGMLLNEHTLFRDQDYFEAKRWLLNRLTLGPGILAGLDYKSFEKCDEALAYDPKNPPKADPAKKGEAKPVKCVRLLPGVAVDGYGREIVVPDTITKEDLVCRIELDDSGTKVAAADPAQFVEAAKALMREADERRLREEEERRAQEGDKGRAREPAAGQERSGPEKNFLRFFLRLEITYYSSLTDHEPVRAGSCPTKCEASAVREGFRVRFRPLKQAPHLLPPGAPEEELPRSDPGWPKCSLLDVFPLEPHEDIRHRRLAQVTPAPPGCKPLAADAVPGHSNALDWVPLGFFQCDVKREAPRAEGQQDGEGAVTGLTITDLGRYYRQIFSNDALSRLVLGLAERVDEAARVRLLTYDGTGGASGEGQSADVYQFVPQPLAVKVTDGKGNLPPDLVSVRVQFDPLSSDDDKLYTVGADGKPATPVAQPLDLDAAGGTVRIAWQLGKAPGLHTVAARIVAAKPDLPPFHPGAQLVFHATARPTAPTVVGMEFRHWYHHHGGCLRWHYGKALLRIFFSRRMSAAELAKPRGWLGVWRMVMGKEARRAGGGQPPTYTIPLGPERVAAEPHGDPAAVGNDPDEQACWYADYSLRELLADVCEQDTLRALVTIRPTDALTSDPFAGASVRFPVAQQLDADLEGSFVSKACRDYLWEQAPPDPVISRAHDYMATVRDRERPPDVTPEQSEALHDVWHRFQPRERPFPSGDGVEGGELHKAFELRLPLC
jgi:hypothetical protein